MSRLGRVLVAAAVALALAGCGSAPGSPTPVTGGQLAARSAAGLPGCPPRAALTPGLPAMTLECLGGDTLVDVAALGTRPVLLVFWAQWCEPCRRESPVLAGVLPAYAGRLTVLLVDTGESDYGLAVELLSETGLREPVVVDPDWALQAALGLPHSLPRSVLVVDGAVALRHEGGWLTEADLRTALAEKAGLT